MWSRELAWLEVWGPAKTKWNKALSVAHKNIWLGQGVSPDKETPLFPLLYRVHFLAAYDSMRRPTRPPFLFMRIARFTIIL